jgi:hypothetical protein
MADVAGLSYSSLVLSDPIILQLEFDLSLRTAPTPRDLIGQLYLLEVVYAESYSASRDRPLHGRAARPEAIGEWRHWLNRGGDWPLEPPPMPQVPAKRRLRIVQTELHSPWHLVAAIPPDAWKVTGGAVGGAIVVRLRLVASFVKGLEDLAGLPGGIRNAALDQQLREARTRGLIAEAELERLRREDALAEYQRENPRPLELRDAELQLPETPEVDEPERDLLPGIEMFEEPRRALDDSEGRQRRELGPEDENDKG